MIMTPKKVLITGAGGMLGCDMTKIFSEDKKYAVFGLIKNDGFNKIPSVHYVTANVKDSKKIKSILEDIHPDIIIHCAALVDVGFCEINKKEANLVNVKATKVLAETKNRHTKFIYISTDSLFDGKIGNYGETEPTHPLNVYSKSKLEAEKSVLSADKDSLVIRTHIFGFHTPPRNAIAEWALQNWKNKKTINGFTDSFFNPIYTKQLARTVKHIVEKKKISGVLNIGSEEILSKYFFLKLLADAFSYETNNVKPISSNDIQSNIARPKNTSLNTSFFKKTLGQSLSIFDGLNEMKKDYQSNSSHPSKNLI